MRHGLLDLLSQCVPGREQLVRTELLRTKYKAGRKLTAYYRLHVGADVRPIALAWSAESPSGNADATDIQDQAAPRHLVAPFERLCARTHGGQTSLLIAPIDPQMPQLMRLNDHAHVISMLENLAPDSLLSAGPTRIQAVRYRPGQRHVLHISRGPDRDGSAVYIKIDRDDHAARAVRFAQEVGPLLAERSPGASLVKPLGYAASDRAAVWRGLSGTTMSQEVRDPVRAAPLFSVIGKAVRVLHDLDYQSSGSGTTSDPLSTPHLPRAELASTLSAGQHLTALLPSVGARYQLLAAEVLERLEDVPTEDPRLGHGDLKCDNILAAGDRIFLLDLDRTGPADPAMDLGKFLADLRWWGHHHSVDVARPVREFLNGYGQCDPARLTRAHLISVLFHLKLGARRIPVHAADWDEQVTRQVGEAAASLRGEAP